MEFRKVPLLKSVSRRGKNLFAAAKTNCSDSPELPGQGVTGPDRPTVWELLALAAARNSQSSGAQTWMSRKSMGLYRSYALSPFSVPVPAQDWINMTSYEHQGGAG